MNEVRRVNWGRGLFRLWLVLSVIWITTLLLLSQPFKALTERQEAADRATRVEQVIEKIDVGLAEGQLELRDGSILSASELERDRVRFEEMLKEAEDHVARSDRNLQSVLAASLVPPIVILAVGLGLRWAVRGFQDQGPSEE